MSESLQEYLAAKRAANMAKRAKRMTIPVTGYEERFAARYRILGVEDERDVRQRHEDLGEQEDGMALVDTAADLILAANEDLLEITGTDADGKSTYQSLGKQWMAPTVGGLFGVDVTGPAGAPITARDALKLVLAGDQIIEHYGRIVKEKEAILTETEAEVQGEATPSSEGSESLPLAPPAGE